MKCVHCDSDTGYPDRQKNGGRCAACGHPFAFEPKMTAVGGVAVSDGLFRRAIQDVSANDTLFFTEKQLWYEFNRRLWSREFIGGGWAALAGASGVGGFIGTIASGLFWPLGLGAAGIAFGVTMLVRAHRRGPRAPRYDKLPFGRFRSGYLGRWVKVHGPIPKLLPAETAPPQIDPREAAPAPAAPPDVTAYSFDRALVTDNAAAAAMLVANNFHFENSCAILSRDGFPHDNGATILDMLRRNPQLTVFALHDASVDGCLLAGDLRRDRWFPAPSVRIFDLGLRPRHAQATQLILTRREASGAVPPELERELSPEEAAWLGAGNVAELESMRPARLMRATYQGFARAAQAGADAGADGGGVIWVDTGYGGTGGHVYAADSFG